MNQFLLRSSFKGQFLSGTSEWHLKTWPLIIFRMNQMAIAHPYNYRTTSYLELSGSSHFKKYVSARWNLVWFKSLTWPLSTNLQILPYMVIIAMYSGYKHPPPSICYCYPRVRLLRPGKCCVYNIWDGRCLFPKFCTFPSFNLIHCNCFQLQLINYQPISQFYCFSVSYFPIIWSS
jgi:hypothetical protein